MMATPPLRATLTGRRKKGRSRAEEANNQLLKDVKRRETLAIDDSNMLSVQRRSPYSPQSHFPWEVPGKGEGGSDDNATLE